jgi:hypothetical protein
LPTEFAFDSANALRMPLVYPGFADTETERIAEDSYLFNHPLKQVDLTDYVSAGASVSILNDVAVSNPEIFQVRPKVTEDGQLQFRVSGKPGFRGQSDITVHTLEGGTKTSLVTFQVSVQNEGQLEEAEEPDDVSYADGDSEWLYADDIEEGAEGEGPSTPSDPPTTTSGPSGGTTSGGSGGGGDPPEMSLVSDDTDAEEPYVVYCGTVDDTGSVKILPPTEWQGGDVSIDVGGTATPGDDYTLSVSTGSIVSFANGTLRVTVPDSATEVVITVTALADEYEAESNETVTFAWDNPPLVGGFDYVGSAQVTIIDFEEGLSLTAECYGVKRKAF